MAFFLMNSICYVGCDFVYKLNYSCELGTCTLAFHLDLIGGNET